MGHDFEDFKGIIEEAKATGLDYARVYANYNTDEVFVDCFASGNNYFRYNEYTVCLWKGKVEDLPSEGTLSALWKEKVHGFIEGVQYYTQWFAVVSDEEDTDWGTGSFDYEEAVKMAKEDGYWAVLTIKGIWVGEDGECLVDPICEHTEVL